MISVFSPCEKTLIIEKELRSVAFVSGSRMTSLDFFPEHQSAATEIPEWGTLEEKSKKKPEDLWIPKRATWTCR